MAAKRCAAHAKGRLTTLNGVMRAVVCRGSRGWASAAFSHFNGELFERLCAMSQDELVGMVALCVARTLDGVSASDTDRRTVILEKAVDLDMRGWKTTGEGYFAHVTKAVICRRLTQFAPTL